ncbi:restriction endonuclease subunit S [Caldovatus aquaticus]|uniref:Restriction endonuclease subunit S n=1 Tax=Caldovatus aquaticus TaxID=2865671 RepID=A0ABS7F301_9PROT|nr:restriction endonuclease subunit S [Caldovatus aquaticus]MBW8269982.1 restriction endonuclease subunit S [Caldovatus aquaticus]
MSLPAYPAYRDSGVPWLGQVPAHWEVVPLKRLASFAGGGTPNRDVPAFWNGDVPWVSPKDMKSEVVHSTEEYITEAGLAAGAASLIEANAVLMVVRSGILRHTIPVAINDRPVALNQDMKAIRFDEGRCQARFLLRLVQGLNDLFLNLWRKEGATVESIEHSYLAGTTIPLPPPAEQRAIAAFLDRECGKIDALVAEQERLIALLKEKRQAVISHTVTKGLDPSVPMKDSGVPWLGQVPAHWEVVRGRLLFVERDERSEDGTETLLTVSHLTGVTPRAEKTVYMFEAETTEGYKRCHPGDLVINTLWAWMGAMGVADQTGIVSPAYHVYTPRSGLEPSYVNLLVRMDVFAREAERWSKGVWSSRLRLYPEEFFKIAFPRPPEAEQRAIIAFLDHECSKLDTLTAESEHAIALLKERRAALISAAVTGRIDVRGLVPAAEARAA